MHPYIRYRGYSNVNEGYVTMVAQASQFCTAAWAG